MKFHLGCGKVKLNGFINIDADEYSSADIVCDLRELKNIATVGVGAQHFVFPEDMKGSVQEIVMFDVIEHFILMDALRVLKDCYEILISGGLLTIRTNDLDRLIRQYVAGSFLGISTPISWEKLIWHIFAEPEKNEYMGHRWGYNRQSLLDLLLIAGFERDKIYFISERRLGGGLYPYCDITTDLSNMVVEVTK